jgi:hypothetical protein
MKKVAPLLLIIALFLAFYLVLFSPFKSALPLPFIIAVTIIASVALMALSYR